MNRVARWRMWLGNLILGRRPPSAQFKFVSQAKGPVRPFVRQPWMSAPEDELGVPVPVQQVLTTSADAVVILTGCEAFTSGFQLGVGIRKKHEPAPIPDPRLHREMPEMSMQIGIRFADGRATERSDVEERRRYFEAVAAGEDPALPAGPIIGSGGGGGGGRRWDWNYWIWPLPPEGPMTVTCHWPAGGVPDGHVDLDGSAIRRAGEASRKLW